MVRTRDNIIEVVTVKPFEMQVIAKDAVIYAS